MIDKQIQEYTNSVLLQLDHRPNDKKFVSSAFINFRNEIKKNIDLPTIMLEQISSNMGWETGTIIDNYKKQIDIVINKLK